MDHFDWFYKVTKEIVDKLDPMNIWDKNNNDEYNPEITQIAHFCNTLVKYDLRISENISAIAVFVHYTFTEWFDTDIGLDLSRQIAEYIVAEWLEI
jgi:hypothetical protein